MSGAYALEYVLRRDRTVVIGGLASVVLLSWLYLLRGAGIDMHAMADMAMPMAMTPWTAGYFALIVSMWGVMMAAMMLPSAAPMILLYTTIARRRRARGDTAVAVAGVFALGYVAVWMAFSLTAAALQWGLDAATLLSPMMATTSIAAAGLVLVAAGLYQWTPLKQACLRQCQSPLDFILGNWREGARGALIMGLRHGLYCLGCCWMLMLLLFVGGVMNLLWIAGLGLFILVEKTAPGGQWLGRVAGAGLIAWGGATLLSLT
jgi:predicted metal-binding membrane protein